jgi:NADPH:quinone reductase-like Zn-dependent oxidoreductase
VASKQLKLMITDHKAADLEEIARLLEQSNQKPKICEVFPFSSEGVEKGFKLLQSRRAQGKIVFNVGL